METILLANNGYIKLSDFAFAKSLPTRASYTRSVVGVPDIIPPEMLLGRPYSYSVDWWQLGIAMFEMLTSRTPFFARSMFDTHRNVLCSHRLEFPSRVSCSARRTCRLFLQVDVRKRLGCSSSDAKEVKEHVWFQHHVDWSTMVQRAHPAPYSMLTIRSSSLYNIE